MVGLDRNEYYAEFSIYNPLSVNGAILSLPRLFGRMRWRFLLIISATGRFQKSFNVNYISYLSFVNHYFIYCLFE
jgi:hypothetical protein